MPLTHPQTHHGKNGTPLSLNMVAQELSDCKAGKLMVNYNQKTENGRRWENSAQSHL